MTQGEQAIPEGYEVIPRPKLKITPRALYQRIDRKLRRDGKKLCTARKYWDGHGFEQENTNLGRYYIIDTLSNSLHQSHVELERLGQELGVMAAWEEVGL